MEIIQTDSFYCYESAVTINRKFTLLLINNTIVYYVYTSLECCFSDIVNKDDSDSDNICECIGNLQDNN